MNAIFAQRLAGAVIASLCLHTLALVWLNPPAGKGFGANWRFAARLVASPVESTVSAVSSVHSASTEPIADAVSARPPPSASPPAELPAPAPEARSEAPLPASPSIADPLIAFSLPVPDAYLPASAVDVRAVPVNEVMLVYPEKAFRAGVSGKVMLMVLINEQGGVDDVFVVRADPPGYFEQVAEQATRDTLFAPAMKAGRAVKSRKLIEVEFTPHDPGAAGP